jgi:hypothetical protein
MNEFRIVYDDQPDEVVDKVSDALEEYGLTIEYGDGDDGYQEYKIVKIEE